MGRLLSVPANVWLVLIGEWRAAFVLFSLAGASDALDGLIAKRFNARTRLGRYLDPLADKVLLVSMFAVLGVQDLIPTWLVILVVFRDVVIVGAVLFLNLLGQVAEPRPRWSSKINTAMQILAIAFVLADLAFGMETTYGLHAAVFIATGITTVASGVDYLIEWARRLAVIERVEP